MTPGSTVAFYTLGCKLNFTETSTISRQFEDAGFAKVPFESKADYYVINTCSVTENADKKCKQLVQKVKKHNPDGRIIITGCYAQLKPQEILNINGVDLVIGAEEKFNILSHIHEQESIQRNEIKFVKKFFPSYSVGDRTRSFLKVQDGCDYFCSFCTIPLARGTSRNASISDTVKVAEEIVSKGVKEIVLTGVNIGDFGKSTHEDFLELIKALDKVQGVDRFRISSIEPNLLSNEIIDFVAQSKKFVPHFHIPLQSGSEKILSAMRRRYSVELYKNRIEYINQKITNCCIGVDVIVGFPGETDDDFLDTFHFLKNLDISYLHVFPYSERENTTAVRMSGVVDKKIRQQRCKALLKLSDDKKRAFYLKNKGKLAHVLFEGNTIDQYMFGYTENYLLVKTPFQESFINTIQPVSLDNFNSSEIYYSLNL